LSSTSLIYNGVVMRDVELKSFSQVVEYDESGTDVVYSRFRIRVASTMTAVHPSLVPFGIGTPGGLTAAQRARDIQGRLSEPRKDFWFVVDDGVINEKTGSLPVDTTLLIATGSLDGPLMQIHPTSDKFGSGDVVQRSSVLDSRNGPHPISVNIEEIVGGRTIRVEFEIEVCRQICSPDFIDQFPYDAGGPVQPDTRVLNNRWHIEETKDENWCTTRTISGTLRVRHHSFFPHAMRFLVVPPLLRGYQRVRQSFQDDPTGLVLKYQVEDKQREAAPPWPAVNWKAHHAESGSGPNGSILTGEVSVRLVGPPGVDKTALIGAAGKVAIDRIKGLGDAWDPTTGRQDNRVQIINCSVVNVLDEPVIELRVQARYTAEDQTRQLAIRLSEMGRPMSMSSRGSSIVQWNWDTDNWDVIQGCPVGTVSDQPNDLPRPQVNNPGDRPVIRRFFNCIDPSDQYDPRRWPVPLFYDSPTPAGAFSCYLQSPCSVWHGHPGGGFPPPTPPATRPPSQPSGWPDESTTATSPDTFPDDDDDNLADPDVVDAKDIFRFPYTVIDISNRFATDTGWCQLPYADDSEDDDTPNALLVKLHSKIARRILTMTATRDGRPPIVPSLEEDFVDRNGVREVLAHHSITLKAPQLLADGRGRQFAVLIEYIYLLERGIRPTDKILGTSTMLDRMLPQDNDLDLENYQDKDGKIS